MNSDTKKTYDSAVDNLIVGIGNDYDRWSNPNGDGVDEQMKLIKEASAVKFKKTLYMKSGRKFDKVIHGTSVWGFVAKTDGMLKGIPYFVGDVFKAASWASPAKHVRGSIFATEQNWFAWTGPNYR
jgi:nicotinamide mononucleotide adenylyltransferase